VYSGEKNAQIELFIVQRRMYWLTSSDWKEKSSLAVSSLRRAKGTVVADFHTSEGSV
jgi:hypothetical protein